MTQQNIVDSVPVPAPQGKPLAKKDRKNAQYGAMFGFFVDMYDIFLPVVALAPAMVYFQPETATTVESAVFAALIFAASIVGRPLGSLIFGPLSDRIGRRKTTLIAAGGSAVCTGLMCIMPGYAQIGLAALVLLIILRLFDGAFIGGEYTAANPLAMEHAPKHRRGVYGSLINMGFPLSLAFITLVTIITLQFFPAGTADSPYAEWGWRIPFFIGFILCSSLFFVYLRSVPESDMWESGKKQGNEYRQLLSGSIRRVFLLACVTITGLWLSMNGTISIFSNHFQGLGVSTSLVNTTILAAALISAALFPVIGYLSQKIGRRNIILIIGALILVVGSLSTAAAVSLAETMWVSVFGAVALITGFTIWATITAFLIELFPTHIRATGYGVTYALPSIIPAFYAYYMVWLGGVMPYEYTPAVITALGGLFIVVGAAFIQDARHKELSDI